jgi:hypothetical protein
MQQDQPTAPSPVDANAETEASESGDTKYESPLKPLLWIVVPFVLTLLYGILAPG